MALDRSGNLPPVAERVAIVHRGMLILPNDATWPDAWASECAEVTALRDKLRRHGYDLVKRQPE